MYEAPRAPRGVADQIEDSLVLCVAGFRRCWPIALLYGTISSGATLWMFLTRLDATSGATSVAAARMAMREAQGVLPTAVRLAVTIAGLVASLAVVHILLEVSRGEPTGEPEIPWQAAMRSLPAALLATVLMFVACSAGMLALVLPGLYVTIRLVLWIVALMDERSDGVAALRSSWQLTRGEWWPTFGLLSLVSFGLALAVMMLMGIAHWLGPSVAGDLRTRVVVTQTINGLLQVIGLPLVMATLVVRYRDLQLRMAVGTGAERRAAPSA